MEFLKYTLIAIDLIVCVAIIILALLQAKNSPGASDTIMGGEAAGGGNFYEKNKGRTKEGKMKRWTIILTVVFAVISIVLGIVWELTK